MITPLIRKGIVVLATAVLALPASAAIVRLNATIDAAQETTTSTSTATGTAQMWYDTAANTFTLSVSVNGMANTISASHVHEAAAGAAGGVASGLGDETAYTRSGNDLTARFTDVAYGGTAATLLSGGAYINIHSAAFPGGEIRGQLIAENVNLWAKLSPEQETHGVTSDAYGVATMDINPNTGKFQLIVFNYNFTNTLTASHIHEGAAGANGGVVNGLGGAADYNNNGNTYSQVWNDVTYSGDIATLLNGGSYINVHSDEFGAGEIRGQLWVSDPATGSRLSNVSCRGAVGAGEDSLVAGFVVDGTEPLTVVLTGRGPILDEFGITGFLADPVLTVHDRWGNQIFWNDNNADTHYLEPISQSGFAPSLPAEAAAILILPPGPHTMTITGAGGSTGIAIAEAFHLNN